MLAVRGGIGGVLMGLANLVPGISGGTMLLAAGVYPRFIAGIAEVTTFRFRLPSLVVLASVVIAAVAAIGGLAGPVKVLVVENRWVMYSIFIGLTLGGVPVVWKLIGRATASVWIAAVIGLAGMTVLAIIQSDQAADGVDRSGFAFMLIAGIVAASAMILPGISGGYMFLVIGVYVPVLAGIEAFVNAGRTMDLRAIMEPFSSVVLPVGIGVVIGVVVVSNILKLLLSRFAKPTLGVLLGLLVGAVAGLWPFQRGVPPEIGTQHKGQLVTSELIEMIDPHKYPTEFFTPSGGQVLGALALIVAGFIVTALVARLGRDREAGST